LLAINFKLLIDLFDNHLKMDFNRVIKYNKAISFAHFNDKNSVRERMILV